MAEIKWIKLSVDMFDDEKIKLIQGMPEADAIIIIWIRLLSLAGKTNDSGLIYMTREITYTDEMLSTLFNKPLNTVRLALDTLKKFRMIEVSDNNAIHITNWEKHQNLEGMDRVKKLNAERNRRYRERQKQKALAENPNGESEDNVSVTSRDGTDIEEDKDIDLDIEKDNVVVVNSAPESEISNEGIPAPQDTAPVPELDTDSSQKKISLAEYRQQVIDKYIQRRGRGLDLSIKDEDALVEIIKERVPLRIVLQGIDKAFDDYKPEHTRDKIRSLNYCVPIILGLYVKSTKKRQKALSKQKNTPESFRKESQEPLREETSAVSDEELQAMLARMKSGGDEE